jgi:phosphoribosylamine--glycine ligase/phosphoribosylformylglycinamidine cyclo-ligase
VKYLDTVEYRVVIKASGLAAGKGVLIPTTKEEGQKALHDIMVNKIFGSSGKSLREGELMVGDEVVIEEFLEGDEISILAFSDGYTITALPAAQDHKRVFDGDKGPNTGGMGCYAPAPVATPEILSEIQQTVLQPTIDGMRKEGNPPTSPQISSPSVSRKEGKANSRLPFHRPTLHRLHVNH